MSGSDDDVDEVDDVDDEEKDNGGGANLFSMILQAAPIILDGVKFFWGKKEEKNEKEENKELEQKLSNQLDALKNEKSEMEKINKQNENRIKQLEEMMRQNLEDQKRKELEREKELIEKEREKKQKEIEDNKREQEAILKCKQSLTNQYTKGILKTMKNFSIEEEKWLNSLSDQNKLTILRKKLNSLFHELYSNEKIEEKINRKFIDILKNTANKKELNKMNFMIIGSSGVGKSTLINQIFGEDLAEEGSGKRCTAIGKKYISKKVPFLTLYDSVGTEIGEGHTLEQVQNETLDEITKNLNINDPNEHIHCIVYCTTSNRIFKDELKVILKIREKYDGKKLPIVIVFTRALDDDEVESKRKAINEFLNEFGEKISDDIFGITFIKVHAKEKISKRMGKKVCEPCFGLSNLIETCHKKGAKSYTIAIKNSLIEIAKNSFIGYIQQISEILINNINFYLYLSKKFQPNFSDFISYCFEKITDIENQKGIKESELDLLEKYVSNNTKEANKFEQNKENKNCVYCKNPPKSPFKCGICKSFACEECYLGQFERAEIIKCPVCDSSESFNLCQENENKINEPININNNNIISNINLLQNNLNMESRNSVSIYVEEFKKEMLEVVNDKFEEFVNQEAKNIYFELLEKFKQNTIDNNMNMKGAMKSREELTSEAATELKNQLRQPCEENFLKKMSSNLFRDIIKIFVNEMTCKIKNFVKNLNNNKEVNKFFEFLENDKDKQKLKIDDKFDELVRILRKKEEQSQEKALKYEYGYGDENDDNGESGETGETGESGESVPSSSYKYK